MSMMLLATWRNVAKRGEKELLLPFGSEAEVVEAISAVNRSIGVDGDGYVAARVSHVSSHGSGSTAVASTSPSSGSLIKMKQVCETMDKKIEFAPTKNSEMLSENFQAIQKSLQKLGDRQDEANKDRKLLQQHQMHQYKVMRSMFQGMKKSFADNFVNVVDADEEPDCPSDDGSVRIVPGHERMGAMRRRK